MQRRWLRVACLVVVEVPVLVAVIRAMTWDWAPVSDWALIDLQVRSVGTGATPLVGAYSRFGWNHPGPGLWYVMAVPMRLLGGSPSALLASAALVHGAAAAGVVLTMWRRAGATGGLIATVVVAALLRSLGPGDLVDPWNPLVPLVLLLWYLVAVWDAACGRAWSVVTAFVVGSLVVQSHIAYVPVVLATGVTALVLGILRHRRSGAARVGPRRWAQHHPRVLLAGWAAIVVLWLPPLLQQVTGERGNLGSVAGDWFDAFTGGGGVAGAASGRVGFGQAARLVARDVVVGPRWLVGPLPDWLVVVSATSPWWLLVPAVLLGTVGWVARRRGRRDVVAGQVLAGVALLATVGALAGIRGYAFDWLTRATWPVGAFAALMLVWGAVAVWSPGAEVDATPADATSGRRRVVGRVPAVAVGAVAVLVAAALTVGGLTQLPSAEPRYTAFTRSTAELTDQTARWLRDEGRSYVQIVDRGTSGFAAFGLLDGLDRAGFTATVPDGQADVLVPGRGGGGRPPQATLQVVAGDEAIAALDQAGALRRIAYVEPTPAEREAGVQTVAVFV